jgi:hypothetical protein
MKVLLNVKMNNNISVTSKVDDILITLDIDWAPDYIIDWVAEKLICSSVRATWFVTHLSPAVERLRAYPEYFELGIHPNFLPGSSHGSKVSEVLNHCMSIVPEAISMRTHSLLQSSPLLAQIIMETPIKTDVSLYLPHAPNLNPVYFYWKGQTLRRLPFFWEDDLEMERPYPLWRIESLVKVKGLKIFAFHPIHIYINSSTIFSYTELKKNIPNLMDAPKSLIDKSINKGEGTITMFHELIEYLALNKCSRMVKEEG